jgi:hypothetical protein
MAANDATDCTRGGGHELPETIARLNDGDGDGITLTVGDVDGEVGFFAHGITSRRNISTVLDCCQYPVRLTPSSLRPLLSRTVEGSCGTGRW